MYIFDVVLEPVDTGSLDHLHGRPQAWAKGSTFPLP